MKKAAHYYAANPDRRTSICISLGSPTYDDNDEFIDIGDKVPGYDLSNYVINEYGVVKNKDTNRALSTTKGAAGYISTSLTCRLCKKSISFLVHRLVCFVYNERSPEKLEVDHLNGKRDDNHKNNLQFVTASENSK
jgi:hypothetical protein